MTYEDEGEAKQSKQKAGPKKKIKRTPLTDFVEDELQQSEELVASIKMFVEENLKDGFSNIEFQPAYGQLGLDMLQKLRHATKEAQALAAEVGNVAQGTGDKDTDKGTKEEEKKSESVPAQQKKKPRLAPAVGSLTHFVALLGEALAVLIPYDVITLARLAVAHGPDDDGADSETQMLELTKNVFRSKKQAKSLLLVRAKYTAHLITKMTSGDEEGRLLKGNYQAALKVITEEKNMQEIAARDILVGKIKVWAMLWLEIFHGAAATQNFEQYMKGLDTQFVIETDGAKLAEDSSSSDEEDDEDDQEKVKENESTSTVDAKPKEDLVSVSFFKNLAADTGLFGPAGVPIAAVQQFFLLRGIECFMFDIINIRPPLSAEDRAERDLKLADGSIEEYQLLKGRPSPFADTGQRCLKIDRPTGKLIVHKNGPIEPRAYCMGQPVAAPASSALPLTLTPVHGSKLFVAAGSYSSLDSPGFSAFWLFQKRTADKLPWAKAQVLAEKKRAADTKAKQKEDLRVALGKAPPAVKKKAKPVVKTAFTKQRRQEMEFGLHTDTVKYVHVYDEGGKRKTLDVPLLIHHVKPKVGAESQFPHGWKDVSPLVKFEAVRAEADSL